MDGAPGTTLVFTSMSPSDTFSKTGDYFVQGAWLASSGTTSTTWTCTITAYASSTTSSRVDASVGGVVSAPAVNSDVQTIFGLLHGVQAGDLLQWSCITSGSGTLTLNSMLVAPLG